MDTMSEKTGGMWHLYWSGGKKDPSLTELLNEKFCYFKLNLPFLPARQISAKVYESLGIPHFCGIVDRTRLFKMYQDSRKPQIPLVETPTGRRNKFFKVRPSPANKGYPLRNLFRKSSVFSTERRDKSTAAVKPKGADTPFRTRKSVTFSQGVRVIDISPNPERKSMRTPSGGSPRPPRDLAEAGTPVPQAIEEPDLRTRQLVPEIHTEQDILPETRPVVRHELEEAHGSAEASVTEYVPEDGLREVQVLAEPRSFTGKDIMNFQPDQEEFNTSSRAGESVIAESLSPEGEPPSALDTSEEILQVVVTDTPITSVGQENFTISEVPLKETQNRNKNPASSEEDASVIEGSVSDPGTDIEISIRTLTNLSLFENATVFRPASVNQSEDVIQNNISEHEKIAEKNKVELFIARDDMYKETSSMSELKNKSPNEEKFENIDLNSSSVEDRNQDSFHQRVEEDQNVFELNINPAEESDEPEKVDNEKEAREHVDFLSASERSFSVQMGAGGDEANKLSIREPQVYTEDHNSPSNDPNEKVSVTENYETSFLRRARIMRYRETDESSLASEGEQLGAVDNNDEPSPIKGNDTLSNTDTMSFLREATSFLDLRDKESPRATGKSHQPCSIAPKRLDFTGEVLRSKGSTMSESLSRDNTVKNVERRLPSEERSDADYGSPLIPESPRATKKSHQPCSIVPRGLDFTDQVLRSKSFTTSVSLSRDNAVQNVERRPPSEERTDDDHGSPPIPESPRATKKSHQPCSIVPRRHDFTDQVLRSKSSSTSGSLSRGNTVPNVERRLPSEERSDADHGSPLIPESPRATKKSDQPCSIVPKRHNFTDEVLRSKSSSTSGSLSRGNTVPNVESRPPSKERSDADHGSPLIPESPRATKKSNQPCSIVPRRHDFTDQVLRRKSSSTSGSLSRGNTVPNVESRPPSEERSDADRGSPLIPESPRATKKIDQPCSIVPRRHDFTDEVQRSKSSTTSISLSRDNTVQNVESRPPSEVWSDGDYGSPLIPENVDLNQSTSEFYTSDIIVSPGHIASFEEVSTAYETEKETGRLQLNRYIRKQESEEIKKDVSSSQETEPAPKIEEIPSKIVDGHLEHNNENRLTSLMLDCTSSQETKPASQFLKSIAKNEFDVPLGDLPPERDILSESNSGSSPNRDHEQEIVFDTAQRMGITEVQLNRKELAERYDGIEAADQNNNSATSTHAQKHLKSHTISFLQEWFQSKQVLEELQVNTEPVNSKNTASESLSIINETVPEGSMFPRSNSKNNATSRNAVDLIDSKNSDEGILEKIPNSQVNSCSVSIVCNTDSLKTYDRGSVCRKLTELKERKMAEVLIESENNKRELQNESLDDTSKLEDSRNQNAGDSPPKGGSGSEIVESSDESPDLGKTRGRKRKKSRHQRARFLKNRPAVNTVSSSEEDSSYLGGNKRGRHTWHSAFKKNSQAHFLKMKKRLSWHEGFDRKLKTHQSAQKQSTESKKKPPRYKETQHLTNESVLANLDEITPEKRILNENHHNTKQRTEQGDQGNNVPISDLSHVVRAESFELFKEKKLIPSKKADAEKPFQKPKTIREALLYEKWYRSQLGYSVSSERPTEVDTPRSINSGVTHEAETGEVSADASSITSRKKSMSSVDKIREPIKSKLSEVIPGYFSKASELQTQSTTPGGPTLSAVNPTTHTKFIEVSDGINKRKRKLFAEDEAPGVNEKVTNPEHIQLVSARSDKSLELSHCKQTKRHRLLHSDEEKENLATHPENMNPSRSGISSDSMSRNAPFVGRKRVIKSPSTKGKEIEGKDIASTKYQHEGIVEKPKIPAPKSSCVQWHNTANTSSTASNESAALSNLYRRSYFIPSPSPNRSYSKS